MFAAPSQQQASSGALYNGSSRYRSEDGGSAATHGVAPLSAISYPPTSSSAAYQQENTNNSSGGLGASNSGIDSSVPHTPRHYQPYQTPQQQLPPLQQHHHHPQMRLPPIDIAPPRRHSLAVTSHLERYRAHDATPPPHSLADNVVDNDDDGGSSAAGAGAIAGHTGNNNDSDNRAPQLPPPLSSAQQQPYSFGDSRGGESTGPFGQRPPAQKPPASFLNYTPSVANPSAGVLEASVSPNSASGETFAPSSGTATVAAAALSNNGASAMANNPSATAGTDGKPVEPLALSSPSQQKGYYYSSQQQHQHPAPLLVSRASESKGEPNGLSDSQAGSRRESAYSGAAIAERIADTRRSSIIALTNPQSEDDVRLENTELKRRLDEMEAKYLKEMEKLNQVVRELEIEKSLLKSLLMERSGSTSATILSSSPPPPQQSSVNRMNDGQQFAVSTPVSPKREEHLVPAVSGSFIRRQPSLSELPLAQRVESSTSNPSSSALAKHRFASASAPGNASR
ncbi:hypothetical protein BX070DRAFT_226277, partial [Coemansia spiralis]